MKIKLIFPPVIGPHDPSSPHIPLGVAVLNGLLKEQGYCAVIEDLAARFQEREMSEVQELLYSFLGKQIRQQTYTGIQDRQDDDLAAKLLEQGRVYDSDVVGFSLLSYYQLFPALLMAEKLKTVKDIPIIFGGAYVTAFPNDFMCAYGRSVDYAVGGDGERPLLALLNFLQGREKLEQIPSLWYRGNNKIHCNPCVFDEIEEQSCPDFSGMRLESYVRDGGSLTLPYILSRGCSGRCRFCLSKVIEGPLRAKSVRKIITDIEKLQKKYAVRNFVFQDSNLNVSSSFIRNLCNELVARRLDIRWQGRATLHNLDEDCINLMAESGCRQILWGLETGSFRLQKTMGKYGDIATQEQILRTAAKAGIKNRVSLIIRYPGETDNDLQMTIDFIKQHATYIEWLVVFQLLIWRGTNLFEKPTEHGIRIRPLRTSFYTSMFTYEPLGKIDSRQKRRVLRTRNALISYYFKKFESKRFAGVFGFLMRYFGSTFVFLACRILKNRPVYGVLSRWFFKRGRMRRLKKAIELLYWYRVVVGESAGTY